MWKLDCEESWAPKNWCFWTMVLEKTLESPLAWKEINQSILKETSPVCSLEGLMLKLKLQYFSHLMKRVDSLEKTLMLGGIEGRRRRRTEDEMDGCHHWLDGHELGWTLGVGDGQGVLACCNSWGRRVRHNWVTELNWVCICQSHSCSLSFPHSPVIMFIFYIFWLHCCFVIKFIHTISFWFHI